MVLDTSAVVAVLLREPGWEALADRMAAADVAVVGAPTLLEDADGMRRL
jgi:ribonuclease VapC